MLFLSRSSNNLQIQGNSMSNNKGPRSHAVPAPLLLLLLDRLHFSPSSVKFYSNSVKGAGQRSPGSPRSLEKSRGAEPAAFQRCLFWSAAVSELGARTRMTGPSVPRGRRTVAGHTPAGAPPPPPAQGLTVTGKPELGNTGRRSGPL